MPDPQDASVCLLPQEPDAPQRRLSVSSTSTHSEASFSFTNDNTPQSSQTSVSSHAPSVSPVIGKCRRSEDCDDHPSKRCRVQRDSSDTADALQSRTIFVEGLVGESFLTRRDRIDYLFDLGAFCARLPGRRNSPRYVCPRDFASQPHELFYTAERPALLYQMPWGG